MLFTRTSIKNNSFISPLFFNSTRNTILNNRSALSGNLAGIVTLLLVCTQFAAAQTLDPWPKPTVALYDCDCSAAATGDSASQNVINTCSRDLLRDILNDTSTQHVSLFSYGYADTTATDFTLSGLSFPLPDTGRVVDADYVIASTLVRNAGGYSLTVSLLDGHTFTHAIDSMGTFGAVSDANLKAACETALQKILPLTTRIRNYQELLKTQNPLWCINPQIALTPAQTNLAQKASTDVDITAMDCDGTPLSNRQLTLAATTGTLSAAMVQTGADGKATVTYTAAASNGMAILTATMPNALTVTHDTINPDGSEAIAVGTVDSTIWELDFTFSQTGTGYIDTIDTLFPTTWSQSTVFYAQSAQGKLFGPGKLSKDTPRDSAPTVIDWNSTSGKITGTSFMHLFSKSSSSQIESGCPDKHWSMLGSSSNYKTKASAGPNVASVSYNPNGYYKNFKSFTIGIPYTMVAGYSYKWYLDGAWDTTGFGSSGKQTCRTFSHFDGGQAKIKTDITGDITLTDTTGTLPGFSMQPVYNGASLGSCTIMVNGPANPNLAGCAWCSIFPTMYASQVCFATLKPFSSKKNGVINHAFHPRQFSLGQNFPNPFHHTTVISYQVPVKSFVSLKIFDLLGKEVAKAVSETKSAGYYTVAFNAADLKSGAYLYQLQAGAFTATKRLIVH